MILQRMLDDNKKRDITEAVQTNGNDSCVRPCSALLHHLVSLCCCFFL